ncbi:MAG: tetratricopeptide repeat protein [Alphaproteobacteria bacterium]|nr:tetratricopeptide repeat protein [Alphaproteobacteria bacterium]
MDTNALKTLDACQQKLTELVASVSRNVAPGDVPDVAPVARELSAIYVRMGDLLLAANDLQNTATCYAAAQQLDAGLATTETWQRKYKTFLAALLKQNPLDTALLKLLGETNRRLRDYSEALECFKRARQLDPKDADSLWAIATVQQNMGDDDAATETFRRVIAVKPLLTKAANKAPPDFSVLILFAPGLGNTPTEYLTENQPYETNTYPVLAGVQHDAALLKQHAQVIFNAVSEADQDSSILPDVARIVAESGLPVINPPDKIAATTRDRIPELLKGIPHCRIARIVRHTAGDPADAASLQTKIPFAAPLLVRPAGTHGGEGFESAENFKALEKILKAAPDKDHFLIEYIDYKSPDGNFRKYRFFFIDGRIMPYHLAISGRWKVHHETTEMDMHQWMQDEEKAFLENPAAVFSPQNYQALNDIRKAVGLEYFGIDCAIDRNGDLVVFEANATMLAHGMNHQYPYKTPFVEAIRAAFNAMLQKYAGKI